MMSIDTEIGRRGHRRPGTSIDALTTLVRGIVSTARIWRARDRDRRELAARSERELRDMGTCWAQIAHEVSKPFWRG
jgi:uncharacterized protein YjiS (DUF1127 family)